MSTFIKRFFLTLGIFSLLCSGFALLLMVNSGRIKDYILEKINSRLQVKVSIRGDVNLTFFSSFPQLKLNAGDVVISSGTSGRNIPFLKVGEIGISLNIPDLIQKKVTVSGLTAEDGLVDIYIPKKGKASFDILKESKEESDFKLSLNKIKLSRCTINYNHVSSNSAFSGKVQTFQLNGNLQAEEINVNLKTKFRLLKSDMAMLKSIQRKWMIADGNILYKKDQKLFSLNNFALNIERLKFITKGSIQSHEKYADIHFEMDHTGDQPMDLIGLLPDSVQSRIKGVECKGSYSFHILVDGIKNKKTMPELKISCILKNAEFKMQNGNSVAEVNADFFYSRSGTGRDTILFELKGARQENNRLRMKAKVFQLSDPWLEIDAEGIFQVNNLLKLAGVSPDIHADGKIDVEQFRFRGYYNTIHTDRLSDLNLYAKMKLQEVEFTANGVTYGNMKGALTLNGDSLGIDNLSGNFLGTSAEVNGIIIHPLSYATSIRKGGKSALPLDIRAEVVAPRVDINRLISAYKKEKPEEEKRTEVSQVVNFTGSIRLKISEFIYREFNAKELTAKIEMTGNRLTLENLTSNVFQGDLTASGSFTALPDNSMDVGVSFKASKMDLQELLKQTRNFDQNTLTDKNLKGYLSAEGNLGFRIIPRSGIEEESISGELAFTVDQGELIEFKPLQSLSTFIRVEELARIRFQKLTNQVLVHNGKIMIPQMEVNSTAVNLQLKGEHDFKNNIDYRVKVNLRKVLANKLRRNNTDQTYIETDPYEGANLLLRISGNISSPLVQYDRQSVKNKLKEDFKKERDEIRNLFKKDASSREKKSEEEYYFNTGSKIEFLDLEKP